MLDSGLQRRGISLANKNVVELYRPSFSSRGGLPAGYRALGGVQLGGTGWVEPVVRQRRPRRLQAECSVDTITHLDGGTLLQLQPWAFRPLPSEHDVK